MRVRLLRAAQPLPVSSPPALASHSPQASNPHATHENRASPAASPGRLHPGTSQSRPPTHIGDPRVSLTSAWPKGLCSRTLTTGGTTGIASGAPPPVGVPCCPSVPCAPSGFSRFFLTRLRRKARAAASSSSCRRRLAGCPCCLFGWAVLLPPPCNRNTTASMV